jgi:hypothetical protein
MDETAKKAAAEEVAKRRDELIAERQTCQAQRAKLAERERQIDRELADCRVAARVLGLDVQFPSEDSDGAARRVWFAGGDEPRPTTYHIVRSATAHAAQLLESQKAAAAAAQAAVKNYNEGRKAILEAAERARNSSRPRISDIVLDRLREAGASGSKAAPIQEYIEQTYATKIHEKTVGMTLYRLSKDGLVRRDGHTWFFVPPSAETKNPGVGAPGLEEVRSK